MKIFYSPYYDGDIFLGDTPTLMGSIFVGNAGLLDQLQLRAGLHLEAKSDIERDAEYHNAMMQHIRDTAFEKSATVDPFGVASKLLQWRDTLVMAGWDGTCTDQNARKIIVLANIEKDFHSTGSPDCWKKVREYYSSKNPLIGCVESIQVDCPWDVIPSIIQQTLTSIENQGTKVEKQADSMSDSLNLDVSKVRLVEFEDVNDAYEWFATIEKLPENTAVINRDNSRLNHTLYTWNKPMVHSSLKDSNPQLLQLFKLSMSIFSRPLNIQNLVSYLLLPKSPIPGKLRGELARLILSKGGFGDKAKREDGKIRDDWEEIIKNFEFVGKDGNMSPQAIGVARAKKMPFLDPIRKDYSEGISKQELINYIVKLEEWILGYFTNDELPEDISSQFHELRTYFNSFSTALGPLPEKVQYSEIEKLILQIYRPMNYSLQSAEIGSSNVIENIRALAIPATTLLWLDCQEEDFEYDAYDFLSPNEREYLTQKGCVIPDFAKHLEICRNERLRLVNECRDIILVRSKFDGSKRLGEHSIVTEARHAYPKSHKGQELVPTPVEKIFNMQKTTCIDKPIDIFQPVMYIDLENVNYPGRKESNSSLDTLINLPFNYVMQYVAKLPKPDEEQISNPFTTTGLVAHNFFEHIIGDAGDDLNKMRDLTNKEFDQRLESSIDATGLIMRQTENAAKLTEFRKQLKESMLAIIDIMDAKEWKPVGCEMPFPTEDDSSISIGRIPQFGARIDFLLKTKDEHYVIIDFKWSYSKSYVDKLKDNAAIQLELYRQVVLATYEDKKVDGVGYYLMPKNTLYTIDFDEIPNSKLIRKIDFAGTDDLFNKIQNSYEFRMEELKKGHIEEGETMEFYGIDGKGDITDLTQADSYYSHIEDKSLCPLDLEEKYVGRAPNNTLTSASKNSERVFKPSKKITFEKKDAAPSDIATSHSILKGRLK